RVLDVWRAMRPSFQYLPLDDALRIAVRLVEGGAAAIVQGGAAWPGHEDFFASVAALTELWWKPEHGRTRRLASRSNAHASGASFVQVNANVAVALRDHVL